MKKILVMPLLQMPSGHHQVAEALINKIENLNEEVLVKKIDLISYTNKTLEKVVTKTYLEWISRAPNIYQWLYKTYIYSKSGSTSLINIYNHLFMKRMEQLINVEQPHLIICTHSFPSMLLARLKIKKGLKVPVINAYTDFFINDMWGKQEIDLHFVPNKQIKLQLINEGVNERNIYITGIPIDEEFKMNTHFRKQVERKKILITGGNSGLGDMKRLLKRVRNNLQFDYFVLCGNNQALFQQIQSWKLPHIKPISYVSSRKEMSYLYDQVDAVITKPGGVTISEAIQKKIPIFIHASLPGQEKVNLAFLKEKGLVFELAGDKSIEQQLQEVLMNENILKNYYQNVNAYHLEIDVSKLKLQAILAVAINHPYKPMRRSKRDQLYVSTSY